MVLFEVPVQFDTVGSFKNLSAVGVVESVAFMVRPPFKKTFAAARVPSRLMVDHKALKILSKSA